MYLVAKESFLVKILTIHTFFSVSETPEFYLLTVHKLEAQQVLKQYDRYDSIERSYIVSCGLWILKKI